MKILIVEDNEENRKLFKIIVESGGHATILASDGEEAVETAKREIPDLILMDIQMPKMNGIEAAKILKSEQSTAKIPIIALTAYAMIEEKEKLGEEWFDGYISKPVGVKDILKVIDETVQRIYIIRK
ncbi:MAG: response regulator [Thermodesulfovibrionales bacterium]|nr:response regulator [Nitrospinota bacterium]MCG2709852.1 response regulator [Thermodesulfovibrionales bacterium]MDP3049583.1 response regulator [Thermodesulfovibrionales bacterium]